VVTLTQGATVHGRESDGARKRGMVNSQDGNGRLHQTSIRILGNEGNQEIQKNIHLKVLEGKEGA
jgi:hypothetical protein